MEFKNLTIWIIVIETFCLCILVQGNQNSIRSDLGSQRPIVSPPEARRLESGSGSSVELHQGPTGSQVVSRNVGRVPEIPDAAIRDRWLESEKAAQENDKIWFQRVQERRRRFEREYSEKVQDWENYRVEFYHKYHEGKQRYENRLRDLRHSKELREQERKREKQREIDDINRELRDLPEARWSKESPKGVLMIKLRKLQQELNKPSWDDYSQDLRTQTRLKKQLENFDRSQSRLIEGKEKIHNEQIKRMREEEARRKKFEDEEQKRRDEAARRRMATRPSLITKSDLDALGISFQELVVQTERTNNQKNINQSNRADTEQRREMSVTGVQQPPSAQVARGRSGSGSEQPVKQNQIPAEAQVIRAHPEQLSSSEFIWFMKKQWLYDEKLARQNDKDWQQKIQQRRSQFDEEYQKMDDEWKEFKRGLYRKYYEGRKELDEKLNEIRHERNLREEARKRETQREIDEVRSELKYLPEVRWNDDSPKGRLMARLKDLEQRLTKVNQDDYLEDMRKWLRAKRDLADYDRLQAVMIDERQKIQDEKMKQMKEEEAVRKKSEDDELNRKGEAAKQRKINRPSWMSLNEIDVFEPWLEGRVDQIEQLQLAPGTLVANSSSDTIDLYKKSFSEDAEEILKKLEENWTSERWTMFQRAMHMRRNEEKRTMSYYISAENQGELQQRQGLGREEDKNWSEFKKSTDNEIRKFWSKTQRDLQELLEKKRTRYNEEIDRQERQIQDLQHRIVYDEYQRDMELATIDRWASANPERVYEIEWRRKITNELWNDKIANLEDMLADMTEAYNQKIDMVDNIDGRIYESDSHRINQLWIMLDNWFDELKKEHNEVISYRNEKERWWWETKILKS